MLHRTVDWHSATKGQPMNPIQSYIDVLKPFAQPYLAMVDAYATLLQSVGGGPRPAPPAEPASSANGRTLPELVSRRAVVARKLQAWQARRDEDLKTNRAAANMASGDKARQRVQEPNHGDPRGAQRRWL